jgi:hypothetical protein
MDEESIVDGDVELVKRCDVLLRIRGWAGSSGSIKEIDVAIDRIPIYSNVDRLVINEKEITKRMPEVQTMGNTAEDRKVEDALSG